MMAQQYPEEFLSLLQQVRGKRARIVVEHILAHGFITTEDLEVTYGYSHPPRAIRDVREQGIPIERFRVKSSQGRTIAAYRFGDPALARLGRIGGRRPFSRVLRQQLLERAGNRCAICLETFERRYLQVDHRVPYEVKGDTMDSLNPDEYMLLCGSCNRAKSWSCEHCANWLELRKPELCQTCYWSSPEIYSHVALDEVRRLDIVWTGAEIELYELLRGRALASNEAMPDYVKAVLEKHLRGSANSEHPASQGDNHATTSACAQPDDRKGGPRHRDLPEQSQPGGQTG